MKKCLRKKCQKEFEPNKPKQVFCSAKCRVYFSREEKDAPEEKSVPDGKTQVTNLNMPSNSIEPKKPAGAEKSNFTIKTMPDGLDRVQKLRWLRENS